MVLPKSPSKTAINMMDSSTMGSFMEKALSFGPMALFTKGSLLIIG